MRADLLKKQIDKAMAMPDSNEKLMRLNILMLRVDYLSPLWYKLNDESRRLQDAGYTFGAD